MQHRRHQQTPTPVRTAARHRWLGRLMLCALFACTQANAQLPQGSRTLQQLTDQRLMLTAELDQFRETLQ